MVSDKLVAIWTGKPSTKQSVYACTAKFNADIEELRVSASWNGATDARSWEACLGDERNQLQKATTTMKNGFEAEIRLSKFALVKALQGSNSAQSGIVEARENCSTLRKS